MMLPVPEVMLHLAVTCLLFGTTLSKEWQPRGKQVFPNSFNVTLFMATLL